MLGFPYGKVFLVPWSEEWEFEFSKEKQLIEEHIGKIDIAMELRDSKSGLKCITNLEQLNYKYRKDILPERYYFNKGEPRTHQIHMYEQGNPYLIEQLKFRDYLIDNKTSRMQYEQLKIQLSTANPNDKHKYAEDKTNFIKSILAKIND